MEEQTEVKDLKDFMEAEDAEFRRLKYMRSVCIHGGDPFAGALDFVVDLVEVASLFLESSPEMREFVILSLGPAGPFPLL